MFFYCKAILTIKKTNERTEEDLLQKILANDLYVRKTYDQLQGKKETEKYIKNG